MRRAWPMRAGPGVREEGKRLEGTRYNCIRFSVSLLQKVINFMILVRKVLEYVLSLLRTCTGCLIRKSTTAGIPSKEESGKASSLMET